MIYKPLDVDLNAKLVELHKARIKGRPGGCHLSQIVQEIAGRMEPGRYSDGPVDPAVVLVGFLWEDVLSSTLATQMGWQQREAEVDGVEMTLDGFDRKTKSVLEAKATKISSRHKIDAKNFWLWRIRTQGYCRAFDVNKAKIVVLHINGGYEGAGGRFGTTTIKGWELKWTARELEENWRMVMRVKKEMEDEGKATW
jgi:hypothetical protein